MRVIGGEFRSRKLKAMPGMELRPTPDRLRESLFSILAPEIEGKVFLDAYAGSGAVGIEAVSRGAKRAILIESHRGAVEVIRENLAALGIGPGRAQVVAGRVIAKLPKLQADIVFLDPPYPLEREYGAAMDILGEMEIPLVIVQHSSRLVLQNKYGNLRQTRVLKQGDNTLSFYRPG